MGSRATRTFTTMTTFEEATAERDRLEQEVTAAGAVMQTFPRGAMGLTPDHVKATPEWQEAYTRSRRAFVALQNFTIVYVKAFKKELAAQRKLARPR